MRLVKIKFHESLDRCFKHFAKLEKNPGWTLLDVDDIIAFCEDRPKESIKNMLKKAYDITVKEYKDKIAQLKKFYEDDENNGLVLMNPIINGIQFWKLWTGHKRDKPYAKMEVGKYCIQEERVINRDDKLRILKLITIGAISKEEVDKIRGEKAKQLEREEQKRKERQCRLITDLTGENLIVET